MVQAKAMRGTLPLLALLLIRPAVGGVAVDRAVDFSIAASAGLLWLGSEFMLKEALAPAACRWCDTTEEGGDDLNAFDKGVREALVWSKENHKTARLFSNLLAYGGVPALMAGTAYLVEGDFQLALDDTLLLIQAGALAALLNQTVKFIAGRDRPETHYLGPGAALKDPADARLSFFSGHTTFTMATATAAVGALYLRGRDRFWAAALLGWPLALATGYFRIAADKHYASDVLVGAAVGLAVGATVAWLHQTEDGASSAPRALSAEPSLLALRAWF